jgi:hypothetical protein
MDHEYVGRRIELSAFERSTMLASDKSESEIGNNRRTSRHPTLRDMGGDVSE